MKPIKLVGFAGGLVAISAGLLALQALVLPRLFPPRLTDAEIKGAATLVVTMCGQMADQQRARANMAEAASGDQKRILRVALEEARRRGCID